MLPLYIDELVTVSRALLATDFRAQGAQACDYLAAVSYVLYGYMWYKNLLAVKTANCSDIFRQSKQHTAAYFFQRILPKAKGLFALLSQDTAILDTMAPEHF